MGTNTTTIQLTPIFAAGEAAIAASDEYDRLWAARRAEIEAGIHPEHQPHWAASERRYAAWCAAARLLQPFLALVRGRRAGEVMVAHDGWTIRRAFGESAARGGGRTDAVELWRGSRRVAIAENDYAAAEEARAEWRARVG